MSFFDSVLPSFRGVGVSKRRTQAGTLVLRLMGRCVGLKRPCTGPCLEGRAKKDISMLGPLGSVRNSHWASVNEQERYLFKELKCYEKYFSDGYGEGAIEAEICCPGRWYADGPGLCGREIGHKLAR